MDRRYTQRVGALAFTPDGKTLVSGGDDGNVMAWDVGSGGFRETWPASGQISGVVVSPDGRTAYSTSEDRTVLIWDLSGARRLGREFHVGAGPSSNVSFAVSAHAQVLAVSREGEGVDLWDLQSLSRLGKFSTTHGGEAFGVALSPDGRRLVTTRLDGTVARWDVATRSMIGRPTRATEGAGYAAAFSPDGRMFATAGDTTLDGKTGTFIVWDADTGERLRTFTLVGSPIGPPPGVTFSRDGRFLSGQTELVGKPGQSAVWDISSRRRMFFVKHSIAQMAAFAPDGRSVAFAEGAGSVIFRDPGTGNQAAPPLQGLAGGQIDVSPDGTELALSGDHASILQLWDLKTREQIGPELPGPANAEVRAVFTPDGNHLLAVYGEGTAILWDLEPTAWEAQACAVAGRSLSQAEWSELLPNEPYQQLCP
jgi:WD40 repeat protein